MIEIKRRYIPWQFHDINFQNTSTNTCMSLLAQLSYELIFTFLM